MALVRNIKKQDDQYLTALRELVTNGGGNRQCFDCGQKGPTYVNMTIGSFICTRCSGVLRGLTPPHRVKSISMATFTQDEIDFLKAHGNNECAKTWLGLWDPKRAIHQDHRELMIDKYERKRYYLEPASPLKSLTNASSLISNTTTPTTTNNNGQNHTPESATTKTENNATKQQQQQQIQLKPPNGMRKSHSNNKNNNNNNVNGSKNHDGTAINRVHQMENAFNLKQSAKNFAENNSTTTTAQSGFGSDTNFVADFGTANIFNATTATISNGYAKIQQQSNKIAQQQQQQQNNATNNNNKNYQFMNGVQDATATATKLTNGSSNNENFADFDHAPIYNAAGFPITKGINNHNNNNNDNQRNNNNNNNNNNGKLIRTPSEDRYAALKDLDEQLRESKSFTDNFATNNISSNTSINPFKSQQQQHQHQQIQQSPQTAQQQIMANPFQTQSAANYYQAQMTIMPNNTQNIAGMSAAQNYYNYNNRFVVGQHALNTTNMQGFNGTGTGPNACGFGFNNTMQQEISVKAAAEDFNNPFVVNGSMNSNNPFL